jgi:rhodanese-related sulfurtransferase
VTLHAGQRRRLDIDAAASLAYSGVLLDARAPERYRGDVEPLDPAAGHIPGARNAPTTENLDAEGRLLAPTLRSRYADLEGQSVGVYCGSGITAAHAVLALAVAGHDAALYPGSWSQWSNTPDRPVATGDHPDTTMLTMPQTPALTTASVPASGTDVTLRHGAYEAHIASVGASLRALTFDGRDLVVPFAADEVRPALPRCHSPPGRIASSTARIPSAGTATNSRSVTSAARMRCTASPSGSTSPSSITPPTRSRWRR